MASISESFTIKHRLANFRKLLAAAGMVALLGAGWMVLSFLASDAEEMAVVEKIAASTNVANDPLVLSPEKLQAGNIQTVLVEPRLVQHMHVVTGRLRYDETKHVEVKSPTDGTLTEVLVKPGDRVEAQQVLAIVSSPAIGEARSEVLKRMAQVELSMRQAERAAEIAGNLSEVLKLPPSAADATTHESRVAEMPLGIEGKQFREAFARYQLASDMLKSVAPLSGTGSLPERVIRERKAEVQMALAEYQGAREQASFQATQKKLEADAILANAQRMLTVSQQQLDTLLGYSDEVAIDSSMLSRLEIRAPIAGSIEQRMLAANERLLQSDGIFILADTRSLYVEADIRDNDWPAVSLQPGDDISLTVPAIEGKDFSAKTYYVGRQVNAATNAIPLVAVVENSAGLLRPGMFVRVALPIGKPANSLAVPSSAVLREQGQAFAFVAMNENEFRRLDVTTGVESGTWVEICAGLQANQKVVSEGAFLLKSEALLRGESE